MSSVQTSLKTKSEQSPARDVVGIACDRSKRGAQIANRLEQLLACSLRHSHTLLNPLLRPVKSALWILPRGDYARALAVADKLRHCSRCRNVWHATDLHNRFGESYDAAGTLDACNERFCPSCIAKRSGKSRAKAREGIQRAGRKKNEVAYMITLTTPTMTASSCSLLKSLLILLETWRRFTKKDLFTDPDKMRAGVKGVEFTLGDSKRLEREGREWLADVDGWHPHIHFVCLSSWIKASELRAVWTGCYKSACRKFGVTPEIRTKDGLLNCHLRIATQNTKSKTRGTIPIESAIIEACKYITKFDSWLKIPEDQLLEIANIERWPRMFELIGKCRKCEEDAKPAPQPEARDEERGAYFNTSNLNAANNTRGSPKKRCSIRSKPLREIGRVMIEEGRREKWLELLERRGAEIRKKRREQLALMYPCAQFNTLDGNSWNAEDENFTEAFLRIGGEEILEAAAEDQAVYCNALSDAANGNRETYKEFIRQQEEERWLDYVNYGNETLKGSETIYARKRRMYELFVAEIEKPIEQRVDERELRAARIQQWSIYEASKGLES